MSMTKQEFLRNFDSFVLEGVEVPEVPETDFFEVVDFSPYMDMDSLEKNEIYLEDFDPAMIYDKLLESKRREARAWGNLTSLDDGLNLRAYVNIDKLQREDYSFDRFEKLALLYRRYLRKERAGQLTYHDKKDMENIFNKLLACMIHFFSKKENRHLAGCTSAVDLDDFDSVIAMTLVNCLRLQDKTAEEIMEATGLDSADCFIILNKMGVPFVFGDSPQLLLFKEVMKECNYFPSYISKGVAYYDKDICQGFFNALAAYAADADVKFTIPKGVGFDNTKSSFRKYVTASINKELYKLYRNQIPVHVPARVALSSDIPTQTVTILDPGEADDNGINPAASNYMEAKQLEAFVQQNGETEMTSPVESLERKALNEILCETIRSIPKGEMVLYCFGIDYVDGQYITGAKRTMKSTAAHFGTEEHIVKYAIKSVGAAFKKLYPDFCVEYFA